MDMFDSILIPVPLESICNFWHSPLPCFFFFLEVISHFSLLNSCLHNVPLFYFCVGLETRKWSWLKLSVKQEWRGIWLWVQSVHLSARHHFSSYKTSFLLYFEMTRLSSRHRRCYCVQKHILFLSNFTQLPQLLSLSHELFIISAEITGNHWVLFLCRYIHQRLVREEAWKMYQVAFVT